MARTNRNHAPAANVDALDNIDLDDMFAEEGDGLFDGYDIDLGNMDDLTGGPVKADTSDGSVEQMQPQGTTSEPASPVEEEDLKTTRRTTKRKKKYPAFFNDTEDSDEQPPTTKRTKTSKGTTPVTTRGSIVPKANVSIKTNNTKKNPSNKKVKGQEIEDQPQPVKEHLSMNNKASKSKGNLRTGVPQPPSTLMTTRGTLTLPSNVAAAGQFGGRQKRGTSFGSLPNAASLKGNKLPLMSRSSAATDDVSKVGIRQQLPLQSQHDKILKQKHKDLKQNSTQITLNSSPSLSSTALPLNLTKQQFASFGPPPREFCGLKPSDTLFYPFMPAIPSELTMKSRKSYGLLDRVHSTFLNNLTNPLKLTNEYKSLAETEPIVQLLEEAFKDDVKSSSDSMNDVKKKNETIFAAIGALRKMISSSGKPKLAEDLFSVCSLLQKQYDFLQQNSENMQKWCKRHFIDSDYSALFMSSKSKSSVEAEIKPTVLESFGRRELKVKIICDGFKEPTNKSAFQLVALLTLRFAPRPPLSVSTEKPTSTNVAMSTPPNKSKKRKLSSTTPDSKKSATASFSPVMLKSPLVTYVTMEPMKRRKCIADLISRTALELEFRYFNCLNERRLGIEVQETALRRFFDEENVNSVLHTVGMWRYMDLSGYFSILPESEIQIRLGEIRSPKLTNKIKDSPVQQDLQELRSSSVIDISKLDDTAKLEESMYDRMQSLLVEIDNGEETGEPENDDSDEFDFDIIDEVSMNSSLEIADLSGLTIDERAYLHLRSAGLAQNFSVSSMQKNHSHIQAAHLNFTSMKSNFHLSAYNQKSLKYNEESIECFSRVGTKYQSNLFLPFEDMPESELDMVIHEMKTDFHGVNQLNNRRASYLESVTRSSSDTILEEFNQRKEEDAKVISKCRHLLLKSKAEMKAKTERAKSNADDLALPW